MTLVVAMRDGRIVPKGYVPIPPEIQKYADTCAMNIIQINAQRFFGPSYAVQPGFKPPSGCELFIGRLPRDLYEPELVPFLELAGPFYQLRMMMDFSGTNRGYCFVQYFHPAQADLAAELLNWKEIRPMRPLIVVKSVDNRRLLLAGVPTSKSKKEIFKELLAHSEGVVRIWTRWNVPPKSKKGVVMVTYNSHRSAALARSKILSNGYYLWGNRITVDWAVPVMKTFRK